ncbi:AAA family ATPase [Paenibacillus alginolyticus]|uniref:AAA family ATPase n=1 Tax=Paenibacillus alginolyticus TaxID=59839 RepID=UPI001C275007|nr:AAA family ATPase [Paenibacillus frigoriresistens]
MINGAFGAGKTTAANELLPFVPNNMIFDPEEIGYMLRKLVTVEDRLVHERTDDFQDMELWRVLTVKTAAELKSTYNKHLIVPMTIYKRQNFDYIYDGFKRIDKNVFHFCLSATAETLYRRITKRGDSRSLRLLVVYFNFISASGPIIRHGIGLWDACMSSALC